MQVASVSPRRATDHGMRRVMSRCQRVACQLPEVEQEVTCEYLVRQRVRARGSVTRYATAAKCSFRSHMAMGRSEERTILVELASVKGFQRYPRETRRGRVERGEAVVPVLGQPAMVGPQVQQRAGRAPGAGHVRVAVGRPPVQRHLADRGTHPVQVLQGLAQRARPHAQHPHRRDQVLRPAGAPWHPGWPRTRSNAGSPAALVRSGCRSAGRSWQVRRPGSRRVVRDVAHAELLGQPPGGRRVVGQVAQVRIARGLAGGRRVVGMAEAHHLDRPHPVPLGLVEVGEVGVQRAAGQDPGRVARRLR
jgi:hypothetical protein